MKRIVTIQDISCVGKCSLTVALPVISATGVEAAVIPTAVLSTHTGFKGFTFCDLTGEIAPITEHWKNENFKFGAIYTGYLGSPEQIALMADLFDTFKTDDNLIIIDPVMGDNGKLYPGFDEDFAQKMRKLCQKADVILPNMTEAAYMLGIEYVGEGYDEEYIKDVLLKLSEFGAKYSVLTGISFEKGKLGVMAYNSETKEFFSYFNDEVPAKYHGTGDIFASCFTGAVTNGISVNKSLEIAADYTARCIKNSYEEENGNDYGVNFELEIPYLVERIQKER